MKYPLYLLTLALALSTAALGQATGAIGGVVVDTVTQKPIAEAVVTAHSPSLQGEQVVVTDDAGAFEITLLPAGTYGMSIKRDGFQLFAPEGLVVKGRRLVKLRLQLMPERALPPPPPRPAAVEFTDAMTAPVMISGPNPEYSPQAIERDVQGLMVIRCVVSSDGTVHDCKVLKGLPFMDRPTTYALERRRYKPATLLGKPVDVYYTFNIRLALPK
jgi:TonB family protein